MAQARRFIKNLLDLLDDFVRYNLVEPLGQRISNELFFVMAVAAVFFGRCPLLLPLVDHDPIQSA